MLKANIKYVQILQQNEILQRSVMTLDVSNKPLFIGSSFMWTTDLSEKKWDLVVSILVLEDTILKFFLPKMSRQTNDRGQRKIWLPEEYSRKTSLIKIFKWRYEFHFFLSPISFLHLNESLIFMLDVFHAGSSGSLIWETYKVVLLQIEVVLSRIYWTNSY